MIPFGLRSKWRRTSSSSLESGTLPVPCESTMIETGCSTPIAYATWTVHRSASPEPTMFFATQRAA